MKSEYSGRHSYNVLNYKLYIDWSEVLDSVSTRFSGVMQMTFVPDLVSPLDSIGVNTDPIYLQIDSAISDGKSVSTDTSEGKVYVHLDSPLSAGDTGKVTLYYRVNNPGLANNSLQKGFYLYYRGEEVNGNVVPHTVAYTMSEPSDARAWMPCYDDPSDKAFCEISIRVPDGFTAASNGTLVSKVSNGDGTTTFNWSEDYPIATYLMCATVARFSLVQAFYTKSDGSKIPVQYYVYPEDSSAAASNTECNVDTVVSMIKFFSSLYGEYPFDKYGMTGVEPFGYGGMEHQTITTLNRNYEFRRLDVAHELAHQWWGDMVTLGTWKDIWLNEGFATYSEAMQLQHDDLQAFRNEMGYYAAQYFIENKSINYAIYAPPPGYIFGLAEYYKAAWVLNMLRNIVGDSTFFEIFRTYRADFQFANAVTSDFMNVVNQVTHADMNWFFNEWIYGTGYPVYSFVYRPVESGNYLRLYLKQVQTNGPTFKMPVEFAVYSDGRETTLGFVDSLAYQAASFPFKSPVDSVVFDPNDKILSRVVAWHDSINPTQQSPKFQFSVYPNPFSDKSAIQYEIDADTHVEFRVYDIIGRLVDSLGEGFQPAGIYTITLDGSQLASGAYLVRMNTDFGSKTSKILIEK